METRTIQKTVINHIQQLGHKVALENVYLYQGWECDVVSINKNYRVHEYEIKRSRPDFLADFSKEVKHYQTSNGYGANHFSFVCPEKLIRKDEVPEYAGLYYLIQNGLDRWLRCVKKPPQLHSDKIESYLWEDIALKLYSKIY